uniref:Pro-apoptotic WT1 regulator n=1 Tax=Chelonoidis abingdonii TaxID=106734 RepID=A0A8C0GBR9_CHEAB
RWELASALPEQRGHATTDFRGSETKREKMTGEAGPPPPGGTPAGTRPAKPRERRLGGRACNTRPATPAPRPPPERGAARPPAGHRTVSPSPPDARFQGAPAPQPGAERPSLRGSPPPPPGKSSGPSARKGKGQIEKRKLREKRRSTGVVNIPAAESLDEYDDDETGQKERKREDAITQQNTMQNESASADPGGSYLIQESSRTVSSRCKSASNAPEDDGPNRYSRTDRTGYSRYSRDANSSGNSVPSSALEKRIEELEKELAKERQENVRLLRMTQDKEEQIGKLKEEIDLLNRDLDDIEDENEQLKQENKTLLKVVGQLTR